MTIDANLLSSVVHELVVCTAEYFPIARKGGMWDDKVIRRVAISISYLGIVDTDSVSRRGLGGRMSTTHPRVTTWLCMERYHTSITNS